MKVKNLITLISMGVILITLLIIAISEDSEGSDLNLTSDYTLAKDESYDNIWTNAFIFNMNDYNLYINGTGYSLEVNGTFNCFNGSLYSNGSIKINSGGYFYGNESYIYTYSHFSVTGGEGWLQNASASLGRFGNGIGGINVYGFCHLGNGTIKTGYFKNTYGQGNNEIIILSSGNTILLGYTSGSVFHETYGYAPYHNHGTVIIEASAYYLGDAVKDKHFYNLILNSTCGSAGPSGSGPDIIIENNLTVYGQYKGVHANNIYVGNTITIKNGGKWWYYYHTQSYYTRNQWFKYLVVESGGDFHFPLSTNINNGKIIFNGTGKVIDFQIGSNIYDHKPQIFMESNNSYFLTTQDLDLHNITINNTQYFNFASNGYKFIFDNVIINSTISNNITSYENNIIGIEESLNLNYANTTFNNLSWDNDNNINVNSSNNINGNITFDSRLINITLYGNYSLKLFDSSNIKMLINSTIYDLTIQTNSIFNCTQNITINGNVNMDSTSYLILGNETLYTTFHHSSANTKYFITTNNTFTNIITRDNYFIQGINQTNITISIDNLNITGFTNDNEDKWYGGIMIYNATINYINATSYGVNHTTNDKDVIILWITGHGIIYNANFMGESLINNSQNWDYSSYFISIFSYTTLYDNYSFHLYNLSGNCNEIVIDNYDINLYGIVDLRDNEAFDIRNNQSNITIHNDSILYLDEKWNNGMIAELKCYGMEIDGKLYYRSDENITDKEEFEFHIYEKYVFYNSSGEINLSASVDMPIDFKGKSFSSLWWENPITYELTFLGAYSNISMKNMSDYYFNNIIFQLLNNSEVEYITANGLGYWLNGSWDFLPPLIQYLELINNTIFSKSYNNSINLSVYLEELSYFHSWYYQILYPNGSIMYEQSMNYTNPINATYIYKNYNFTFWNSGTYTLKVLCNDTHNKINKKDKFKVNKAENMKITTEDKEKSVGYWDNHKLKLNGKELYMYDYETNKEIYVLIFDKKYNHNIIYNVKDRNFKFIHNAEVKGNCIEFSINSELSIRYVKNSYYAGHFIIGDYYFFDLQDWVEMKGTYEVSHKMKDNGKDKFIITLYHENMRDKELFPIDPLSGVVNSNSSSYSFSISGTPPLESEINYINSTYDYEIENINFNGSVIVSYGNITSYEWISSIDGIIYNSTLSNITLNNLSVGTHTISFCIYDEFGNISQKDYKTIIVLPVPIGNIISITYMGLEDLNGSTQRKYKFNGGYIQIQNNTIYRYRWKIDTEGIIYNDTSNPINVYFLNSGYYNISFSIQDENGKWSNWTNEQQIYIPVTLVDVENQNDNWFYNAENFITVVVFTTVIICLIVGSMYVIWLIVKRLMYER